MLAPMVWTVESACAVLSGAGVVVDPGDVRLMPRDERRFTHLPGDRLAWFADTDEGKRRLAFERRVLRLIEARCTFRVPRVLYEAPDGAFDLRAAVPGVADPWAMYQRVKADPALARQIGLEIGRLLVEQHTRIGAQEAAGWLPTVPSWPEPLDSVRARLSRVVVDDRLRARIDATLDRYEAVTVDEADRVLVHADLGLHNIAFDPESYAVHGVFDYDGAAWADRHHDFRYLLFDFERDEMLDGAAGVYEAEVGRRISRERVILYNAACAASFLALRDGVPAEERSCGRTLAEDLGWVRAALARVPTSPSAC
jgi:aminoglycoside phosphotransferase (APT) family kinase protein